LTGDADRASIADVERSVAPPAEPAAGSTDGWSAKFWIAVDTHGWRYALRELGWRYGLRIGRAIVAAAFAALLEGTASRPPVKSSADVTREVLAETKAAAPPGDEEESVSASRPSVKSSADITPDVLAESSVADVPVNEEESVSTSPGGGGASTAAIEPDYQRFLRRLEQREREERDSIATRLRITRGREKTLYGAHLFAALLTVLLAFLAVGLVFADLVPVGVASAAVAILPGSGTFLLRRMWHQERSQRDVLDERRNEHAEIVDAIEGALSVREPSERNRLATQLAERLQERAFAGGRP
jgi:hypothetical protein